MVTEELKRHAAKAWVEYGKAILDAFNLKRGSFINSDVLDEAIENNDEEKLKKLIEYAEKQTEAMKNLD